MSYHFDNQGKRSQFKVDKTGSSNLKVNDEFYGKAQAIDPQLKRQRIPILSATYSHIGNQGSRKNVDVDRLPRLSRNDVLVLDLGRHCVGHFNCQLITTGSHPDAPAVINVRFCEMEKELSASKDYEGWLPKGWIQEDAVRILNFPWKKEFERVACRYIKISIIDTSQKYQLVLKNPEFVSESSAGELNVNNEFCTNDSQLKQIDELSLATLHSCMQTVFEDGPKRDRRLWIGDFRIQALTDEVTFENFDIIKRCLYLFASTANRRTGSLCADIFSDGVEQPDDLEMGDYTLLFVDVLANYFGKTKDKETLMGLYETAKRAVQYGLNQIDPSGIPNSDLVQTVFLDWLADANVSKKAATLGIIIFALNRLIYLAEIVEDPQIPELRQIQTKLTSLARDLYFDQQKGLFVSGKNSQINWPSQIWLVRANLFTKKQNQQLLRRSLDKLPMTFFVSPYLYGELCLTLCENDLVDLAVRLIKAYWGKMIVAGAQTSWEVFSIQDAEYSPYGVNSTLVHSYCHGWGCVPAYIFRKYLKPDGK